MVPLAMEAAETKVMDVAGTRGCGGGEGGLVEGRVLGREGGGLRRTWDA